MLFFMKMIFKNWVPHYNWKNIFDFTKYRYHMFLMIAPRSRTWTIHKEYWAYWQIKGLNRHYYWKIVNNDAVRNHCRKWLFRLCFASPRQVTGVAADSTFRGQTCCTFLNRPFLSKPVKCFLADVCLQRPRTAKICIRDDYRFFEFTYEIIKKCHLDCDNVTNDCQIQKLESEITPS